MRCRTWLAVLAAILGAVALWQFFPRYDRSAGLGRFAISREQAIGKAQSVARVNGIDTTGWVISAQTISWRGGSWIYLWRHLHPGKSVFSTLITPFVAQVTMRQPGGERFVGVTMTPEGRVVGFGTATKSVRGMEHMHTTETLDAQADGVLADYLGDQARLFRPVNRGVAQNHRVLYSWEYSDLADSPHLLRFEASFSQQQLVNAELIAEPADMYRLEVRQLQKPKGYLVAFLAALIFVVVSFAFPAFFRALVRRRLSPKRLVSMGVIAFILVGLNFWGSDWLDSARAASARDFGGIVDSFASRFIGLILSGFTMVLFYGAGRALLHPNQIKRWLTIEAALDRRVFIQPVGAALVHGVLCGIALAAIPYLFAMFVGPAQPGASSVNWIFYPSVLAATLEPVGLADVVCIVLLVIPLVRGIRPLWLGFSVYCVSITFAWSALREPFSDWLSPNLVASALFATALWLIDCEFGALAALTAGAAMGGTWTAASYFVQPIEELSQKGWWTVAPFVFMALGGALLMRFGRPIDEAAEVAALRAESLVDVQSQRERLATEFDVARRAQQAMLPRVPAQLAGATFAAICIPARDVGGDLYDFYPTGDGRYAIGVADVSGKGVPASLYMTLTKGFLAAAGRDSDDLLATLSQLNSHLYSAGKRKIFVTMALTFFSPSERRIELARAGHNSPLWRKASEGRSEYLTPPGMGLGLTSRLLFERALRLQEINLAPGDAFVLYSDGITEAMNEAREQFGEERLQAVVDACDGKDAQGVEQAILTAVREFIGTAPPHDDMTLFVVRV